MTPEEKLELISKWTRPTRPNSADDWTSFWSKNCGGDHVAPDVCYHRAPLVSNVWTNELLLFNKHQVTADLNGVHILRRHRGDNSEYPIVHTFPLITDQQEFLRAYHMFMVMSGEEIKHKHVQT